MKPLYQKAAAYCILLVITLSKGSAQSPPDLELERNKVLIEQSNKPIIPNYGIDSHMQRINKLLEELEQVQKEKEIAQNNSARERFQKTIKEATKPEKSFSDYAPRVFDPEKENYDRFKRSPCFKDLGFVPGRDNEKLYQECEERLRSQEKTRSIKMLLIIGGLVSLGFLLYKSVRKR